MKRYGWWLKAEIGEGRKTARLIVGDAYIVSEISTKFVLPI